MTSKIDLEYAQFHARILADLDYMKKQMENHGTQLNEMQNKINNIPYREQNEQIKTLFLRVDELERRGDKIFNKAVTVTSVIATIVSIIAGVLIN